MRDLGCGAIAREVNFLGERLSAEKFWGRVRSQASLRGRSGAGLRSRSNKPNAPEQSQVIGELPRLSVSGDWES